MDENGNENTVHDTQCHGKNETKIGHGSEPLSQESSIQLLQGNFQYLYTHLNCNIAVSKLFNSNALFCRKSCQMLRKDILILRNLALNKK